MKLPEKDVEDRYQSAYGLLCDLKECKLRLDCSGVIEPFPLGSFDISSKPQPPRKVYGREKEKRMLKTAFASACNGSTETVLVSGDPGVGKTMLISDTLKYAVLEKGYYIAGKFDQLERNVPYAPFADAFGSLVKQLMTEKKEKLEWWRKRILNAVGRSGAIVTEIIPELEWLIGKQTPVDSLSPKEAENRFFMVFAEFVKVFAWKGHPQKEYRQLLGKYRGFERNFINFSLCFVCLPGDTIYCLCEWRQGKFDQI